MKRIISLSAAAVAAASMMTASASADGFKVVKCNSKQTAQVELSCAQRNIYHATFTLLWIQQERSRTLQILPVDSFRILKLNRMKNNLTWLLTESRDDKTEALARMPLPTTGDWLTAVNIVQRAWPGSASWLINCSSSEGSHGGWIPNHDGSGAGGWMQYMSGTFYGDYDAAVAYAKRNGLVLPPDGSRNWYSAIGQAYAAGYAYGHNRPAGKWTGGSC